MANKKALPIMVQGTSSHVGKSILTAALCRVLKDRGFNPAPFKAQNMALNSFITTDGGEIGRAQAFQAEAAGILPSADMNPILLKPSADSVSQVIIQGRVRGVMSAREYHVFKKEAKRFVLDSYSRLSQKHDVIIIEGAGSPAEINLRENDLANMGIAEMADSPVVLVGDIDRGGVFASLVGTLELLTEDERARVKGFIINKFRGDKSLLKPGLDFLEKKTGRPVLGVMPYMKGITLPDEDGVSLDSKKEVAGGGIKIAVIRLPRISNFTDFDPFGCESGVRLDYISAPGDIEGADAVIIPGTKNTVEDLVWLREKGFIIALERFRENGGTVAGICGGFQMLGNSVKDPYGMESGRTFAKGLSFIDAETVITKEKNTFQVSAEAVLFGRSFEVGGYEIHMGETNGAAKPFSNIVKRNSTGSSIPDGGVTEDGKVWGTYIHGIFDNDPFRHAFLEELGKTRGINGSVQGRRFKDVMDASLSELARTVEENLDMDGLFRIIGI